MATPPSRLRAPARPVVLDRRARTRAATREEALDHALDVMTESGVGALTISEVARRLGMRGPSLYKHFPSLHALYDALFARGLAQSQAASWAAAREAPPGVARLRASTSALVRWAVENQALAQLLFWRPVPGFEPSPTTFETSVRDMHDVRGTLREAVELGELDARADSEDAVRLLIVLLSGLMSQHMANEPDAGWASGHYPRLVPAALDLFVAGFAPLPDPTPDTAPRRTP